MVQGPTANVVGVDGDASMEKETERLSVVSEDGGQRRDHHDPADVPVDAEVVEQRRQANAEDVDQHLRHHEQHHRDNSGERVGGQVRACDAIERPNTV